MRVLLTGGFGYLGGRLAQYLAVQPGSQVVLGTRRSSGPPSWLPGAEVAQIDWGSKFALEKCCRDVSAIVHLAGMNAADCAVDPVAALEFNAVGTALLLRAAVRNGVRRFIYISTAHVYGSPLIGHITEETCPRSLHPYATSHRAAEDFVRAARLRGDIQGVVVRLSNTFGAPAHKGADCWTLLVNDLCRQAIASERMVLNSSGRQRRDFIALTDACVAIRHLLDSPEDRLGDGLYNVGGAWSPAILDMANRVALRIHAITGKRLEVACNGGTETVGPEDLDFRIEKLMGTGFELAGQANVDREIDDLIRFCILHFRKNS